MAPQNANTALISAEYMPASHVLPEILTDLGYLMQSFNHSDTGNAELLAHLWGTVVRHDEETDSWFRWDTHSWEELSEPEQHSMAIRTAKYRKDRAQEMPPSLESNKEFAFANQSQNLGRIQNMLVLAKSVEPIGLHNIKWNAHLDLIATDNGVINFRDGTIRPGEKTDYLTKKLSIPYDPQATAPRFMRFLQEITCNDSELEQFIQRAVGYTLTGYTREHIFFLLHGGGGNGKSVLINVLSELLGEFSKTVRFTAFEENTLSDAKRDLAELSGVRAAFASEGAELKTLDTSMIKQITGGEPITTSRKYGHPFTYRPQFKLWLTTNHLPKVSDDSDGFWRRVILIPFNATFDAATRENDLQDKLSAEMPGILAWAVRGAKIWFEKGISTPDKLLSQINTYRQAEDEISNFVTDCCEVNPTANERANNLYNSYINWKSEKSEKPLTSTQFGRKVSQRFEKKYDNKGTYYAGVAVRGLIRVG